MPPRLLYVLFMLLALVVFLLARHLLPGPKSDPNLNPWQQATLALAAFIGGSLGAKLPFVFLFNETNALDPSPWLSDGKTLVTGLAGAYVAVECVKWLLGITAKTGDAFALPLALALAVGRWGCYFNGCCAGLPTELPWGADFGDGVPRHPTQIYESLFHLTMAGVLGVIIALDWLPWQRLKLYLIAYGGFRIATETIRPAPPWLWGWTFYQWAAAAFCVGLAGQWLADSFRLAKARRQIDSQEPDG